MSENPFPNANQQQEDLLSPRQNINFTGRPPMRAGMSNPTQAQVRAYQQVNYAMIQNNGFIRPSPYPPQQMNMMGAYGRGPPNAFSQPMNTVLAGQPGFQPQGLNMLGAMQQNQVPNQPPFQNENGGTAMPSSQPNVRPPAAPSTPVSQQEAVASIANTRSSLPPSRSESIPPVSQPMLTIPIEPIPEYSEMQELEGDRLFRDCLDYFSAKESDLSNVTYWASFVETYFSSNAHYRQKYVPINSNDKSYEFNGNFDLIPHMLRLPYVCGSVKIKFLLSSPKFQRSGPFLRITYDSSEIFNQYQNSWTISNSSLCVVFDGDKKIAAWDFTTKDCLEYLSRPVVEQFLASQKAASGTPGKTNATIPELLTAFPSQTSESSAPKKLLEKLECLNAVNLLTPLVEIQRTLKRPISACCELYFNDLSQPANKAQRSSANSTPKLPNSRITPKPKPATNNATPHPPNVMSPLNPARQLATSTPLSVASPVTQSENAQTNFSLTPNQNPSDLGDSAPSKRGRGGANGNRGTRRGRGTATAGRARKVSTPKNPKPEGQ